MIIKSPLFFLILHKRFVSRVLLLEFGMPLQSLIPNFDYKTSKGFLSLDIKARS